MDENIRREQAERLRRSGIGVRQIGWDLACQGVSDKEILPVLHRLKRATFITLDGDFFKPELRHPNYCIVFLRVRDAEVATYVRRLLRLPTLRTRAQRVGSVIAASARGLQVWWWKARRATFVAWQD